MSKVWICYQFMVDMTLFIRFLLNNFIDALVTDSVSFFFGKFVVNKTFLRKLSSTNVGIDILPILGNLYLKYNKLLLSKLVLKLRCPCHT
ncbi:MAG: hypothetical protein ABJB85_11825, partial [Nitrososphaerota archaeon]